MGGRGSSGGTSGAGLGRAVEFSAPNMSGSAKQVSWATDILRGPYDSLAAEARSHERIATELGSNGGRERQQAQAYRAAQNRYAEQVKQMGSGGNLSARFVIDRRTRFQSAARSIAQEELRKRGFRPSDVSF